MLKIHPGCWVMVADGTEARLFTNVGNVTHVSLKQQQHVTPENLLDDGPSGRRPPEEDEQASDEATFAKQLAQRLNSAALNNSFEHLVLMADPQTLGQMRPQLHMETQKRLTGEIAKTMTKAPLEDIERALA